ncbi:MAG: type III toxin-antitoxin system ToxN/AbiQ family toxin [Anaerorhabdus sp.]
MYNLKFYNVDLDYVKELKKYDSKVPNIEYLSNNKFLIGIVFEINNMKFYAPISSFNRKQVTNELIENNNGEAISSVRFSFMFPIPDGKAWIKDISNETDLKYRRLLQEEFNYCNNNFEKLKSTANMVYNKVVIEKNQFFIKKCCDFKLLEAKAMEYNKYKVIVSEGSEWNDTNKEYDILWDTTFYLFEDEVEANEKYNQLLENVEKHDVISKSFNGEVLETFLLNQSLI